MLEYIKGVKNERPFYYFEQISKIPRASHNEKAVADYVKAHPNTNPCDASNTLCEAFLREYGENSFLNTVKGKFKDVQFFGCSALGHNTAGQEFKPVNAEKPILWIIDKMNKSIDLASVWGKSF